MSSPPLSTLVAGPHRGGTGDEPWNAIFHPHAERPVVRAAISSADASA